MIHRLKYGGDLAQAGVLAALLAARVRERSAPLPEALVPVPLHWRRLTARGFNQALELALPLGRALGIPVRDHLVIRERATPPQVGLPRELRRRNLRAAFGVRPGPLPGHLALVDDVVTSASTVTALADCLHRAGVERIEVWAVARADLAN
jgi:ComF family protein